MKIVAIGGGNNSNIKKNGEPKVYEHDNINKEIIKLSGKKKPNVLYVTHASSPEYEESSFKAFKNVFEKMYSCPVKLFSISDLLDREKYRELLNWADVIYVGGGNTKSMLGLWYSSGLADELIELSHEDKVLCGISAGGGCWFKNTSSDYLQMETGNLAAPFMPVKGLGLVDLVFNPHAGDHGRMRGIENITQLVDMRGLSLTDNMAIEIVDDKYKLVKGISSEGLAPEAILSYWDNGKYYIEPVENEGVLEDLTKSKVSKQKKKKK